MKAKVLLNNTTYITPVFALSLKVGNVKAIVFDPSYSKLIVVDVFKDVTYTSILLDHDTTNFAINDSKLKSYWDDRNIFIKVKLQKYSAQVLDEAKAMLNNLQADDFTQIQTESDLDALEMNSVSFHDGYVLSMQQKDDTLEILLDTSWGTYVILKCSDVEENQLELGVIFSNCNMRVGDDGVEMCFDTMFVENPMTLKAKKIQFKTLFRRKIPSIHTDFAFENDKLVFASKGHRTEIDISNCDIFDDKKTLGYIENDDALQRCVIFSKDIAYEYGGHFWSKQKTKQAGETLQQLQDYCCEHGYLFEKYPWFDDYDWEQREQDYGQLLYSKKITRKNQLPDLLWPLVIMMLSNNAIWLLIQLTNPQMDWIIYLIAGVGVSILLAILFFIAQLIVLVIDKVNKQQQEKVVEIYERGIKCNTYNAMFNLDYGNITKIEYKNRIIVHTTWDKFKLEKFKDDKTAYKILAQQMEAFVQQNSN